MSPVASISTFPNMIHNYCKACQKNLLLKFGFCTSSYPSTYHVKSRLLVCIPSQLLIYFKHSVLNIHLKKICKSLFSVSFPHIKHKSELMTHICFNFSAVCSFLCIASHRMNLCCLGVLNLFHIILSHVTFSCGPTLLSWTALIK